MKRLFVALDLPVDVQCRLQLMAGAIPGAKWVPPEKFHITLKFIGEVNEGVFLEAAQALSEVHCPTFQIRLSGVNWFGDARKPRILYAGVEADHALFTLRDRVNTTLAKIGLEPDGRKFIPHVSLAYLRGLTCHDVMSYVEAYNLFQTDPFEVRRFCLYSSQMKKGGSKYTIETAYGMDGCDPYPEDSYNDWFNDSQAEWTDHWSDDPFLAQDDQTVPSIVSVAPAYA